MKADTSIVPLNLIDLPAEVHERALGHLDEQSQSAFRATCHTMRFYVHGFGGKSLFALICLFDRGVELKKIVLRDSSKLEAKTKFETIKTSFLNATCQLPKEYLMPKAPYLKSLKVFDDKISAYEPGEITLNFKDIGFISSLEKCESDIAGADLVIIKYLDLKTFPLNLTQILWRDNLCLTIENCAIGSLTLPKNINNYFFTNCQVPEFRID